VIFDSSNPSIDQSINQSNQVLGLAYMIMRANLPVRLRVLVPAVENAIDGSAYRNGDIIKVRRSLRFYEGRLTAHDSTHTCILYNQARNGKTSEIITTDAEGRLVLADALVEADSEDPDLIIDCATLTGGWVRV
jgi:leucyl aminopeptidase